MLPITKLFIPSPCLCYVSPQKQIRCASQCHRHVSGENMVAKLCLFLPVTRPCHSLAHRMNIFYVSLRKHRESKVGFFFVLLLDTCSENEIVFLSIPECMRFYVSSLFTPPRTLPKEVTPGISVTCLIDCRRSFGCSPRPFHRRLKL